MATVGTPVLSSGTSPRTFNVAVPSGSNTLIVVTASPAPLSGAPGPSACSATAGGSGMTTHFTDEATSATRQIRIFQLTGVATGTVEISVSWSGGGTMRCSATPYTDVHQATPLGSTDTYNGTGGVTSTTHTISSASSDDVLCFMETNANVTNLAGASGGTLIGSDTTDDGNGYLTLGIAHESGAASVTTGQSWTETTNAVGWGVNVANAAAGGATRKPSTLTMLGVA